MLLDTLFSARVEGLELVLDAFVKVTDCITSVSEGNRAKEWMSQEFVDVDHCINKIQAGTCFYKESTTPSRLPIARTQSFRHPYHLPNPNLAFPLNHPSCLSVLEA